MCCTAGFIVSVLAIDNLKDYTDKDPLLPRHRSPYGPSMEDEDLKTNQPQENEQSRAFRRHVDKLARKFENFESLSPLEQQELLDRWACKIRSWGIEAALSKEGFSSSLTVSSETAEKLKKMADLYPRSKLLCIIL